MSDESKTEVITLSVVELLSVSASKAAGGARKCGVKFAITQHDASMLMDRMGQHTYSAIFAGKKAGDGLTVGGVTGKPDDEGNPKSALALDGPQSAVGTMAKLMDIVGKVSSLVLTQEQMTMFPAEDNPSGTFSDAPEEE